MIGFLRGTVAQLYPEYCLLDVNGVGYRVFISSSTRQELSLNTSATLHTYLQVREDAMLLYGFVTTDEYELFQHLITINGIGPKVALGVLSAISPNDFRMAVGQKNAALLTRIPGIGKKTAERMILELKDKLGLPDSPAFADLKEAPAGRNGESNLQQALQALMALGYSQGEIAPVLARVGGADSDVEQLIKLALKEFGRR